MRCIHDFSVKTCAKDNWKTSRKGQNNIKFFLRRGIGQDLDSWRALVTPVMNVQVPYNVVNILTRLLSHRFSGRTLLHGVC